MVSGKKVADTILSEINTLGLDMNKCCGQAYDGGSNMCGIVKG
jgi:hypothetical protein